MSRFLLALSALALALLLSGCATLSKTECETGDWRALGISDGSRGLLPNRFERHVEACAKYEIMPNETLYLAGRTEGLVSYCRLDRAAIVGAKGDAYYNVCEGEIGLSFGRVYLAARDVHEAEKAADSVREEISEASEKLSDPALSADERAEIGRRIQDLLGNYENRMDEVVAWRRNLDRVLASERRRLAALGIEA